MERPAQPITLRCALVVDDQLINRTILERQLATFGLEVMLCRSADEALAALTSDNRFDVILTDYRMPDGNGVALAAELRARGISAPILLLSSTGEIDDEARASLDWVLRKPILRGDLFRALQSLSLPQPTEAPHPAPLRRMRVLAAEDNRTNQLVFRKMVQDFDIDLDFASDGHEAVAQWENVQPDLIFMDISMPDMDGRAATRAIRARERHGQHVPIIALTAHALDGDDAEILAAGLDQYLTKPLRKRAIAETIDRYRPEGTLDPLPKGWADG
jgi:CheY-like chemotaxis protein